MFGTIRKHQTWLWAVIITLTIISFVVFFSPYSKLNDARGPANYGSIHGERISEDDFTQVQREVYLAYFFNTGDWPNEDARKRGFDPMRETYFRLLLIRKLQELGIHVGGDVVAQAAREMLRPLERVQISSPTVFIERVLQPRGLNVDDLERYVRHQLGIQELISTVALCGKLVTPDEVKGLYVREREEVATEAAFFSLSNYLANVTATPEAVAEFFTNRAANYRVPERIQVSYVKYELTNYLAGALEEMAKLTNLSQQIDAVYQQRGSNYYPGITSADEAKEKIREEVRKELMLKAALKHANEFARELYDKEPAAPENLATLAKAKGLQPQVSEPFDSEHGPKELNVRANFTQAAFALNPTNEPFAGPLAGEDAVYVMAYHNKLPSEPQTLDQVRERVTEDYKTMQALNQARTVGAEFSQTVSNGLAQGKTFAALCAEVKVTPVELPRFSISTRSLPEVENRMSLDQIKQLAFGTHPGNASIFYPTMDGGIVLYVKAKHPPDPIKMQTDLPGFVNQVRQSRQNEAFNVWFRKEAERGLRDTPVFQQEKQPPAMRPGGTAKS